MSNISHNLERDYSLPIIENECPDFPDRRAESLFLENTKQRLVDKNLFFNYANFLLKNSIFNCFPFYFELNRINN